MANFKQQSSENADVLAELNAVGGDDLSTRVFAGSIAYGTLSVAATSIVKTATLAFTPTWVLYSQTVTTDGGFVVTTSGTTTGLTTFTRVASTAATVISYLASETAQS